MWQDVRLLNATANTLFGLVALAIVASCLWWVAQRPYFTLKVIRVEASQHEPLRHINPLTVRSAALAKIKGNFFTANLDTVRQTFESVPWVRKATVRRSWPNQLIVTVEEYTPLGTWGDDGRLLSDKGEVFVANLAEAEEDANLLTFDGPIGSEKEVVARWQDLNNWFAPLKLSAESLSLSERYAWTVRLSNGVTVELGREKTPSMLKDRVDRLVAVYPQLVALLQDRIENIDMRYPNGLALTAQGLTIGPNGKKKANGKT
ncbi:cell division protein FtsQ/DivIB [uncultured Oxalicibacterium sp.]|uniref:cell division protein FtsQ/DivIB n=1 Tax=uncultured Oxalicibacterium sp. TaxID=1168540 RepID=UPI0025F4CB96|nr:cell division protein FtsQ/DivIB [uncultured Oxalicibacterium sp.]